MTEVTPKMNELTPGIVFKPSRVPDAAPLPAIIPEVIRPPVADAKEFGLPEVLTLVRRRLRLILVIVSLAVLAGLAFALLEKPQYMATALLMSGPKEDRVVAEQQALSQSTPDSALVDSEVEVLRSPAMAGKLVTALQLQNDPEWNAALREPGLLDSIKAGLKGLVGGNTSKADGADDTQLRTLRAVSESINVRRRGLTYVMEVTAGSESPAKAAAMANALATIYVGSQKDAQIATADEANVWLQERVDQLKVEVQQKEAAAAAYRASQNLLTAEGVSLTEQQIADVQRTVISTRAELAEKQARYQQLSDLVSSGRPIDSIAGALQSEVIRELRVKEAEVTQRRSDLQLRYGPTHPQVEKVVKEEAEIKALIQAEVSRLAANLGNELNVIQARLRTEESSLGQVRSDLVRNNFDGSKLAELEGEASAARSVYEGFLTRLHEVSQQGNLSTNRARIVSEALPPLSPASPNLLMTLALAGAAGLALASVIVFIAEQFRNTLGSPEEVELKLGKPVLTSIPRLRKRDLARLGGKFGSPTDYLSKRPRSAFAESFRSLRNVVTYSMLGHVRRVVAVTSAMANEGKTTVAISLARVAALSGQRVVLVDCDLRRHTVNTYLGLSPRIGLAQVLAGESNWQSVVEVDSNSGLHVIPVADGALSPRDLFGSEAMEQLIAELSKAYDLVVLDCAPVLALAETSVVVAHADAAILVCKWDKTPAKAVSAAIEQLEITHAHVLGVTLNAVDPAATGRDSQSMYMFRAAESYLR